MLIFQEKEEAAIEFSGGELALRDNLSRCPLQAAGETDAVIKYVLSYKAEQSGKFNYGIRILHPSPASPAANRGWEAKVLRTLTERGVWRETLER